jgi:adenylate cyclase
VTEEKKSEKKKLFRALMAGIALVLIAVVAALYLFAFRPSATKTEVASKEKMAFPLPDKPSIAVLPFVNMSGDPKQEFFSDGITEDIITALSNVPGLFAIARNSTFTYKGKPVKVKQVSEELGVRYVLEGSVQKSGDRVRITAQLIDALTGYHLWAERYERDQKDLFALQDEITMKILTATQVKLTAGEQASMSEKTYQKYYKGKQGLDCYLKLLEPRKYWLNMNIESLRMIRRIIEEAEGICPENPSVYIWLGWVHYNEYRFGIGKSPQESLEKGIEMAQKALAIDESSAEPHNLLCVLFLQKREYDESMAEGKRALTLAPNVAHINSNYAMSLNYAGRQEEAIPWFQKALRLDPFGTSWAYLNFGSALRVMGRFEEAVSAYKKFLQRAPDNIQAHTGLAATYIMMGREKEARAEAAEVLRINPYFSVDSLTRGPYKDQSVWDNYISALRKAGLK